jgi:hypothetical protein
MVSRGAPTRHEPMVPGPDGPEAGPPRTTNGCSGRFGRAGRRTRRSPSRRPRPWLTGAPTTTRSRRRLPRRSRKPGVRASRVGRSQTPRSSGPRRLSRRPAAGLPRPFPETGRSGEPGPAEVKRHGALVHGAFRVDRVAGLPRPFPETGRSDEADGQEVRHAPGPWHSRPCSGHDDEQTCLRGPAHAS